MTFIAENIDEVVDAINSGETLVELSADTEWEYFKIEDLRPTSQVLIKGQTDPETRQLLTTIHDRLRLINCANITIARLKITFRQDDHGFGEQVVMTGDCDECHVTNCWVEGGEKIRGEVPNKGFFDNIPWGIGIQLKDSRSCTSSENVVTKCFTGTSISGSDSCFHVGNWLFDQGNDNCRYVDSQHSGFHRNMFGPGTGRTDLPYHDDDCHAWNDKKDGGRPLDGMSIKGNWFVNDPTAAETNANMMLQLYRHKDGTYPRPTGWEISENVIFNFGRKNGMTVWPNIDGVIQHNSIIKWPPIGIEHPRYDKLDDEGEVIPGKRNMDLYLSETPRINLRAAPDDDEELEGSRNVALIGNLVPIETFRTGAPNDTIETVSEYVIEPQDLSVFMHIGDTPSGCYIRKEFGHMGAPSLVEGNEHLRPQIPSFLETIEEEQPPLDPAKAKQSLEEAMALHVLAGDKMAEAHMHLSATETDGQTFAAVTSSMGAWR